MRYCYKKDGEEKYLNLATPLSDAEGYTEITEEAFCASMAARKRIPTADQLEKLARMAEIRKCQDRLDKLDYIGTKISTGRATIEEYAEQIAEMRRLADRINELEGG